MVRLIYLKSELVDSVSSTESTMLMLWFQTLKLLSCGKLNFLWATDAQKQLKLELLNIDQHGLCYDARIAWGRDLGTTTEEEF